MNREEQISSNNVEAAGKKVKSKNKKHIYIVGKGISESEPESRSPHVQRNPIQYQVDDIVCMKKPHPCGSKEWKILRAGADIKIRCEGCGHDVILPRYKFDKQVKKKM